MPGSQTNSNSKAILDVVHKGVRFISRPGCALGLGVFAMHQEVHIFVSCIFKKVLLYCL